MKIATIHVYLQSAQGENSNEGISYPVAQLQVPESHERDEERQDISKDIGRRQRDGKLSSSRETSLPRDSFPSVFYGSAHEYRGREKCTELHDIETDEGPAGISYRPFGSPEPQEEEEC